MTPVFRRATLRISIAVLAIAAVLSFTSALPSEQIARTNANVSRLKTKKRYHNPIVIFG